MNSVKQFFKPKYSVWRKHNWKRPHRYTSVALHGCLSVLGTEVSDGDIGSAKTLSFLILTSLRVDVQMSALKEPIENLPVMCWNG